MKTNSRITERSGFSLVEITLALGIAAFALIGIFGLLPVGLQSNRSVVDQTAAASIASAIATDMQLGKLSGTSPLYKISLTPTATGTIPSINLSDVASGSNTLGYQTGATPRYAVDIVLKDLAGSPNTKVGTITVSWPVLTSTAAKPLGSVRTSIAIDRR